MDNVTTTIVEASSNSGEIERYSDLIHNYGAETVILAVFILGIIAMFGYILRSNQKTNNQLMEQQKQIFDYLVSKDQQPIQPTKPMSVKEPNIIEIFLGINENLKGILKSVFDELNGDRIAVYVFHNGSYSSHGLPFFKVSCVCEMVKLNCGVSKNLKTHTGLPLQMFDNGISRLYKYGKMSVLDIDDVDDIIIQDNPLLTGMLKKNNIKSCTAIAIYDHDTNMLGVLMLEYTETHNKEFLDDIEQKLIEKAPLLSPILEYSGIYNNNTTNN